MTTKNWNIKPKTEIKDVIGPVASVFFALGLAGVCVYNSFITPRKNEQRTSYQGIESRIDGQEYLLEPSIRTDSIYELIDKHNANLERRDFYRAVVKVESTDNPGAVSKAGARGLMQIMKNTWPDVSDKSFDSAFEPDENVKTGIKYFGAIEKYLSERIAGWEVISEYKRLELMAAAYNGGMGRLVREKGIIKRMPQETQNYVEKVMAELDKLENGK